MGPFAEHVGRRGGLSQKRKGIVGRKEEKKRKEGMRSLAQRLWVQPKAEGHTHTQTIPALLINLYEFQIKD